MYKSIRVPVDIHTKLKILSVLKKETIIQTIRDLIDKELDKEKRKAENTFADNALVSKY